MSLSGLPPDVPTDPEATLEMSLSGLPPDVPTAPILFGPTTPKGASPTTPTPTPSPLEKSGSSASTASALSSITESQPGPLSHHWAPTMSARSMPRTAHTGASSSSATGPPLISGGAAKAKRSRSWRRVTRPTPHSWTTVPGFCGCPPASSHAWHVPMVGCPAKGSSLPGVKMRTR